MKRTPLLADNSVRTTLIKAITGLDKARDATVLAATIMPDHVHLLLELGSRLTVSQIVGKTKSSASRAHAELRWQDNFFEHRLKPDDSSEAFALYTFMNPYCAGVCNPNETWLGWIPSRIARWQFEEKLREGKLPHTEWLNQASKFGATLPPGAD